MKRYLLIMAIAILVLLPISAVAEKIDFDLYFNKVGIPSIHFEQSGQVISTLDFAHMGNPTESAAPVSFECIYKIFPGQGVDLLFVPGDSTISSYMDNGTMLKSTKPTADGNYIGLNYSVSVDNVQKITHESGYTPAELSIDERRVVLSEPVTEETGEKTATITLQVNPPKNSDNTVAFMEGQYTGYIIMRVFSN